MLASKNSDADAEDDSIPDISGRDWREVRASLLAGSKAAFEERKREAYREGHWAHPLAMAERGCFLASHPALFRPDAPYLTQSVVFIIEHGPSGSVGLVLNRPLRGSLDTLTSDGMFTETEESGLADSKFGEQPVYLGGPDRLQRGIGHIICGHSSLGDDQPTAGVFVGNIDDAKRFARKHPAKIPEARLFAGSVRWRAGQLDAEVDSGEWYCAAASPLFVLNHCIQLPKPLWLELMESQGEPFAQIARRLYKNKG